MALESRYPEEVQGEGEGERGEHQQVVGNGTRSCVESTDSGMEEKAADQREPGERDQVVKEVMARLPPAKPAQRDRQDADQGRRTAAEQHGREDDPEEAA